jgi:hypothetical protein
VAHGKCQGDGGVSNMMADLDAIALNNEVVKIHHPVVEYPSKVTSLNLDKTPEISGVLHLKYWQSSDSTLVNPTTGNIALASNADLDAR